MKTIASASAIDRFADPARHGPDRRAEREETKFVLDAHRRDRGDVLALVAGRTSVLPFYRFGLLRVMAHVETLNHKDDVFRDIGRMVADSLQITGDENQV